MFGNKKQEDMAVQDQVKTQNTINKGTIIRGDLESYGNIRIDGEVIGNIVSKSKVVLGPSAKVEGHIIAQNAELEGELTGTINVAELLVMKATSVLNGDISTNKMVVESGATFNGSCKMGEEAKEIKIGEKSKAKTEEKPKAEVNPV